MNTVTEFPANETSLNVTGDGTSVRIQCCDCIRRNPDERARFIETNSARSKKAATAEQDQT